MKFKFLLINLTACLFFSSCMFNVLSELNKKDKKNEDVIDNGVTAKASCQYSFNEASSRASYVLPSQKIIKSYFNKSFDVNLMTEVMDLNGQETVRFAQLTGVEYYKANTKINKGSCGYTESLKAAPNDLSDFFIKAGENVLGLYLPKGSTVSSVLTYQAGITVRPNSDRWTLVHEFMHHLFSKDVQTQITDENLKNQLVVNYNLLSDDVEKLETDSSYNNLASTIYYYKKTQDLFIELLKRFTLEEITIESILGEKYDYGTFKNVYSDMRLNGAYYISKSAEKANEQISAFKTLNIQLSNKIYNSSSYSQLKTSITELNSYYSQLSDLSSEIYTLKNKADNYKLSHNLSGFVESSDSDGSSLSTSNLPNSAHSGCSHSKTADEIYELIMSRTNN